MLLSRFLSSWITQLLACMGGCLGCSTKRANNNVLDEQSRGLHMQGPTVKKPSISEDFWSTSTFEMENNGVQSQRSLSSISASTQTVDPVSGSSHNPPEFVNHGLLLWNQIRQQWIENKKPKNQPQQVKESGLGWNTTYDSVLVTNKPFPQHIPLPEMVDFLVDVWEQEGMYD
ncbi:hypothetical protein J5N97_001844 [Dioscorea zingiberensis]|uniref:Gag1-like clamp domain-containing protein n=1 Tax=Dioscorea zingiberensis TaxID=325984 RepID=A0A9D5BTH5_9LILI|nr:hypothetical protein J5N97_001844 [Dioscorea zingiberensis]